MQFYMVILQKIEELQTNVKKDTKRGRDKRNVVSLFVALQTWTLP